MIGHLPTGLLMTQFCSWVEGGVVLLLAPVWCFWLTGLPGGGREINPRLVPKLTQGHRVASEWDCFALGF